ncbi:MAG TPA: ABC transporter ATP-binding protein [Acidimicrobiales bacterium]|nr:ABC transporter ATP-binding protein [Acidimicrobiales bacterium]
MRSPDGDGNPATTDAPAVSMHGVRAAYGRIEILHGVDLVVAPRSVFALFGPNGAGKSTLLKVMSGQLRPTGGSVEVEGIVLDRTAPEVLARAGVCTIPEGRGIFPNLTVRENLRIWTFKGGVSQGEVEARAFTRFPRLKDRRKQLAGTLSGGEQQMLAISRALVGQPRLLLLDEISMGLAPMVVEELYSLVGQIAGEGVTVVLVEQFVHMAVAVADQAAIMVQGRIDREGSPEEMAEAAVGAYLASGD